MGNGGARGRKSVAKYERTPAQDKTVRAIAKRTANLKNEQYRMVDEKGNITVESKGTKREVGTARGLKREHGDGAVSIHNHPEGGTFSSADLSDFGYRVKEIVATAPEGTYRLISAKYGTKGGIPNWVELRDLLENVPEVSYVTLQRQAQENLKNSPSLKAYQNISKTWEKIRQTEGREKADEYFNANREKYNQYQENYKQELKAERRRLETEPNDRIIRENAKRLGFIYKFEPWKKKKTG